MGQPIFRLIFCDSAKIGRIAFRPHILHEDIRSLTCEQKCTKVSLLFPNVILTDLRSRTNSHCYCELLVNITSTMPDVSKKLFISQPKLVQVIVIAIFVLLCFGLAKMSESITLNPSHNGDDDQATKIGRALFEAYDPITTKEELHKRVTQKCEVDLLSAEELQNHPRRNDWSVSRFAAYHNINKYLGKRWQNRSESDPRIEVLDASGSVFLKQFKDILNITSTSYPQTDLHRTHFADNSFDVVSADQVLEHTYMPHLIMLEIHRVLKPGGIAIMTTISFNPLHEVPGFHDLWRFMVDGMLALSMPFKGGVKVYGGWGTSRAISTRSTHGMGSGEENRIFKGEYNELLSQNDKLNPFLVWLVAEK